MCATSISSFLLPYPPDTIWNNFIAAPIHTKRLIIFSWRVCVVAISSRVCSMFQIESKQKRTQTEASFVCLCIETNLDQRFSSNNPRFFLGQDFDFTSSSSRTFSRSLSAKASLNSKAKGRLRGTGIHMSHMSWYSTFSNPITPFLQRPGKFSTLTTTFSSFAFTWQKQLTGWRRRHKSQMIAFHMIKLKNGSHARIYEPFLLIAPQPGPSRTPYTFQQVIFSNCIVHSLH